MPSMNTISADQRRKAKNDQRREQAKEAMERLHERVAEITEGPEWLDWMSKLSHFHSYSPLNRFYLSLQWMDRCEANPDLPPLEWPNAFSRWKDVGRMVKKGEKGLEVFVPRIVKDLKDLDEAGEPKRKLRGYGLSRRVFALSQTEGDEFVPPYEATKLLGDDPVDNFARLEAVAVALGFTVDLSPSPPGQAANGSCNYEDHEIWVSSDREPMQRVKTLAHELGHASIGHRENRALAEVEAETVSFLVCDGLGFDSSDYAVGYVTSWGQGDGKLMASAADRAIKAYEQIMDLLGGNEPVS